jgi:hypothetical protein
MNQIESQCLLNLYQSRDTIADAISTKTMTGGVRSNTAGHCYSRDAMLP